MKSGTPPLPSHRFPKNADDPFGETRRLLRDGTAVLLPGGGLPTGGRAKIRERVIERARTSSAQRSHLAAELKQAVARFDPVLLIGEIAREVHSGYPGERDRAPSVFSWDAKLEHLLGLALTLDPVPTEPPSPGSTQDVMRMVDALFETEWYRIFLEELELRNGSDRLDPAILMLRFEYLMDRMEGYTPHLELIHRAVFEPLRDRFVHSLGFC